MGFTSRANSHDRRLNEWNFIFFALPQNENGSYFFYFLLDVHHHHSCSLRNEKKFCLLFTKSFNFPSAKKKVGLDDETNYSTWSVQRVKSSWYQMFISSFHDSHHKQNLNEAKAKIYKALRERERVRWKDGKLDKNGVKRFIVNKMLRTTIKLSLLKRFTRLKSVFMNETFKSFLATKWKIIIKTSTSSNPVNYLVVFNFLLTYFFVSSPRLHNLKLSSPVFLRHQVFFWEIFTFSRLLN